MSDIKTKYGNSNQAIAVTINGLANDAKRESTAVDNSTNCFLDALVQVKIATNPAADSTGDKSVYVYAYGTADGGTSVLRQCFRQRCGIWRGPATTQQLPAHRCGVCTDAEQGL